MMQKTVVINVVGLSQSLLGKHTPFLNKWVENKRVGSISPVLPAVTCSAQATYLTGKYPSDHGIVANGWYFKDECEVKLWRQSNKLIQSPKIWELIKKMDPSFTCANMFWWYNMYSSVDYSVTPRPMYPADGRKLPDVYSHPMNLRDDLQKELGTFPLFNFWGPNTSIISSDWIAKASISVDKRFDPTLTLVYLPHLDYNLQRVGPGHDKVHQDLQEIDAVLAYLIAYYEKKDAEVIILSEYGISAVEQPIHVNRALRKAGLLTVKEELGKELLDAGASKAFAVSDHQVAHVYINDVGVYDQVRSLLENLNGVEKVLGDQEKKEYQLDHDRSGDLVLVAKEKAWFTYYYWLDDARAPDFARTVDIHRKPGYDPVEMFVDPSLSIPMAKVAWKLLKKRLGFRYLMDVIPLDASLVKGSHGRTDVPKDEFPIFIGNPHIIPETSPIAPIDVMRTIAQSVGVKLDREIAD